MTMLAIATVSVLKAASFGAPASLQLVLDADAFSGRHHVMARAGETPADLENEARALETVGQIDAAVLARDWTLVDPAAIDPEIDALEYDLERNTDIILEEGAPEIEDDIDERVEAMA